MKINWKVRFKNKTFLVAFITSVIAFTYNILGMLSIVPPVSQDMAMNLVIAVINILVAIGIIADPTTVGVGDSKTALSYEEPKNDNI